MSSRADDLTADLLQDLAAEQAPAVPASAPPSAPPSAPSAPPTRPEPEADEPEPTAFVETDLFLAPRTWKRPGIGRDGSALAFRAGPVQVRIGRR